MSDPFLCLCLCVRQCNISFWIDVCFHATYLANKQYLKVEQANTHLNLPLCWKQREKRCFAIQFWVKHKRIGNK